MATYTLKAVAVILCLFTVLHLGSSLQCYTCNSGRGDTCDDKFSDHAQVTVRVASCENSPLLDIPGAGPNTHCVKTKKSSNKIENDRDYVLRGCVPENYCRLVVSEVSECIICDHDRCNTSSSLLPSIALSLIGLLSIWFML